ncbi:MAG: hypothetical protein KME45_09275 [Stenomitos rutilans HA7619-LM2]|jgi:hypothetical protein|nr:hypothetical protein [Stenomitos rutilans HA7619-LM2]
MTAYTSQSAKHAETFKQLSVDDQLAVLWYVYGFICSESGMKEPDGTAPDSPDELFGKAKGLSQDEQLQLMRDILKGTDTGTAREYQALTNNTKLAFWYQLAQGMERSEIIQAPSDYQPSSAVQSLVSVLKPIGFEQQFVFLRDALLSDGGTPSV